MSFSLDAREMRRAINRLGAETKRANKDIAQEAARGFLRDIVKITPPGSEGTAGGAAKKQGERGIEVGIASILAEAASDEMGPFEHPSGIHKEARSPRTGRVDRRVLRGARRGAGKVPVDAAALRAYVKALKATVGILASGWNRAAEKLGVRLPAWIRRHGNGRGEIAMKVSPNAFSVTVTNSVGFVGNVKDFNRRVAWAVRNQVRKMDRRADFLMRQALRKAGWR